MTGWRPWRCLGSTLCFATYVFGSPGPVTTPSPPTIPPGLKTLKTSVDRNIRLTTLPSNWVLNADAATTPTKEARSSTSQGPTTTSPPSTTTLGPSTKPGFFVSCWKNRVTKDALKDKPREPFARDVAATRLQRPSG